MVSAGRQCIFRTHKPASGTSGARKAEATMNLILLIVLILLLVGALPTWPYSAGWGYYPSSGLGLLLLILILIALFRPAAG
jgi:uncharacterized protein DUF3309